MEESSTEMARIVDEGKVRAAGVSNVDTSLPERCEAVRLVARRAAGARRRCALRVAQEALTNVRKHARASSARLLLDETRGAVRLRVADDGCGFDLSAGTGGPGHLGLTAMRERSEVAGGRLSVESAPGQGTTVEVWVPMPEST